MIRKSLKTIPVRPGRNVAVIIEVAAMNYRLNIMGINTAVEFNERLNEEIVRNSHKSEVTHMNITLGYIDPVAFSLDQSKFDGMELLLLVVSYLDTSLHKQH